MVYRNPNTVEPEYVWVIAGCVGLGWVSLQAYMAIHDHRNPGRERFSGAGKAVTPMVFAGVPVLSAGGIITVLNGATPLGVLAIVIGILLLVGAPLVGLVRPVR